MSEMAKSAREAMRAKAQRMGSDRPLEKVDSSTWTPPEMLDADVQTGMRPLKRRNFKSGGKVAGDAAKHRADRKARKKGGEVSGEQPLVDRLVNRDLTKANEYREGKKHIGGLKSGGRAAKCWGGKTEKRSKHADGQAVPTPPDMPEDVRRSRELEAMVKRDPYEMTPAQQQRARQLGTPRTYAPDQRKAGGRAKKFMGGPMMQPGGMASVGAGALSGGAGAGSGLGTPAGAMTNPNPFMPDPRLGLVSKDALNFGAGARGSPYKKGGKVKHEHGDEAADKALIRKMVKAKARTGKAGGGMTQDVKRAMMLAADPHVKNSRVTSDRPNLMPPKRSSLTQEPTVQDTHMGRMLGLDQEPRSKGGRTGRASGGRAPKGKTAINIYVAAGQKQPMVPAGGAGVVPAPMPAGAGPAGRPVPVPPPAAAGAAPQVMPMPVPMPMGGGQAPAPTPRKHGGRLTKVAHSYKDMEAGAGSGEGRLQKTDIAKRSNHKEGGTVGHRSYKSYKDMDAGAGSGFGRLEKTAIAKRS